MALSSLGMQRLLTAASSVPAERPSAVRYLIADRLPQLWHGYEERTWEIIAAGAAAGFDVRVGLEDVLPLPDGHVAADNAELVAAAVELIVRPA